MVVVIVVVVGGQDGVHATGERRGRSIVVVGKWFQFCKVAGG